MTRTQTDADDHVSDDHAQDRHTQTRVCFAPGCLGSPDGTGWCAVHRQGLGRICQTCGGTGLHYYASGSSTRPCDRCGASGRRDARRRPLRARSVPVDQRGLIQLLKDESE